MTAKSAEKTFDLDDKRACLVAYCPPITSMPYEMFGFSAMGTTARGRKPEVTKFTSIMLDIEAKICDNDHTVDGA